MNVFINVQNTTWVALRKHNYVVKPNEQHLVPHTAEWPGAVNCCEGQSEGSYTLSYNFIII